MINWNPVIDPETGKENLPEEEGLYIVSTGQYVYTLEYSNKINPFWKDSDLIFSNGYAFGEQWEDGLDNLEKVDAWVKAEPYMPTKEAE
jgi:hypothetical protein